MDWRWLQRFRVWEANRKQFLYPENYIEPEVRDESTPAYPPAQWSRFRRPRRRKSDKN